MTYRYINFEAIENMLFNESEYIQEFCEAGISSFQEFLESYNTHMMNRDLEDLRKAGHKIKPGAKMMGVDEVVEEYERAKKLLQNEAENNELIESVEKMEEICTTVQKDLSQLGEVHS